MSVVIKDIDKGWKALLKRVGLPKTQLTVGIHDTEGGARDGNSNATVGEVAVWNEFGTGRIPERSFIRSWYDENLKKNLDDAKKVFQIIVKKEQDPMIGLNQLGLRFVGAVQAKIVSGIPPANAPTTIARKGSSTPLIATAQMKGSIRHLISRFQG